MNTPKPPTDPRLRVLRGGSWGNTSAILVRAAYRGDLPPSLRHDRIGFRCAQRGVRMPR